MDRVMPVKRIVVWKWMVASLSSAGPVRLMAAMLAIVIAVALVSRAVAPTAQTSTAEQTSLPSLRLERALATPNEKSALNMFQSGNFRLVPTIGEE
jgi:hypothetical protein